MSEEVIHDVNYIRQVLALDSREYHLTHGMDPNSGKDLFLVIATGQGKIMVWHAPLIAAQACQESRIAFLIALTKVLVE
jgi:hypothetical protein